MQMRTKKAQQHFNPVHCNKHLLCQRLTQTQGQNGQTELSWLRAASQKQNKFVEFLLC